MLISDAFGQLSRLGPKLSERCARWIKGKGRSGRPARQYRPRLTAAIYMILWPFALASAFVSYWTSPRTQGLGLYVLVFASAASLLQGMVYWDLHMIDERPDRARGRYGAWIDRRLEFLLRLGILVFLLLAVGKLLPLSEIRPLIKVLPERVRSFAGWHPVVNFLEAERVFEIGSACAFGLLAFWNAGALYHSWRRRRTTRFRILLFLLASVVSFIYWILILRHSQMLSEFAALFVLGYASVIFVTFVLKLTEWHPLMNAINWLKTKMASPTTGPPSFTPLGDETFKEAWRDNLLRIYERMRTSQYYTIECNGVELKVLPGVYAPKFFTDSEWFAKELPRIVGKGSLLEIGTGTGIVAISCARHGAKIVATDVNDEAVKNAQMNAQLHGLPIDVRPGELYTKIGAAEVFDFIFWAHPFNNWETSVADMLLRSGMDHNYEGLKGYIEGARRHLSPGGRLLLGSGKSADGPTMSSIANNYGYTTRLLVESPPMPLDEVSEYEITYYIIEFRPR